jgi:phenylacetate-CoA ligase
MNDRDRAAHLPAEEMSGVQTERLISQVGHAYANSPFYREAMDGAGVHPEDVRGLDDLVNLPFTTKADIQARFPYGLCAVPPQRIVRIQSSSGSTGQPINTCYTKEDMESWAECMARGLSMAGVTSDDVCQIAFRYTLFTGAFGHHLGAETLGAAVIPTSSGLTDRQLLMMQAFKTTVLHCTPSYALIIAEKVEELGIDPRELPLRLGVHGAESMTDGVRDELQERLAYRVARDYGLTELGGCGVSCECEAQDGYHINEDHFYPEVVDPATGKPLPDGEIGELVFTTLTKVGTPILRYRTRDLTSLSRERCACGRTLVRHGLILGRTDDMLIVGGVNFFPTQVECVLTTFEELAPHYLIQLERKGTRDSVCVTCELEPDTWQSRDASHREALAGQVKDRLHQSLAFKMDCRLVEPFSLPRSEGKSKRVDDRRQETAH